MPADTSSMTPQRTRELFARFYDNTVIMRLAPAERWTVSGMLGADDDTGRGLHKAPIDVRHLLRGCTPHCQHQGPVRGAFRIDSTCLMNLDDLTENLPHARNCAFYLRSDVDEVVILDIEPSCPPEIARHLLRLHHVLYAERSMSGHGYHLLLNTPKNLQNFPDASSKRVLRHPQGWYEILLEHWITFTRDVIDLPEGSEDHPTIEDIWAELAEQTKPSIRTSALEITAETPVIALSEDIIRIVLRRAASQLKTPEDFGNDLSRYEFSVMAVLHRHLRQIIQGLHRSTASPYSLSDEVHLLHAAAQRVLKDRPKHHEMRNSRPYLLDQATRMVALHHTETHDPLVP